MEVGSRSIRNNSGAPPCDASCPRSECEDELVCGTSSVGPNLKRCTPATWGELTDGGQTAAEITTLNVISTDDCNTDLWHLSKLCHFRDLKCVTLPNNHTLNPQKHRLLLLLTSRWRIFSRNACLVLGSEDLLDGLVQTIGAVRHHEGGSAGNHSVVVIIEMLLLRLQKKEEMKEKNE